MTAASGIEEINKGFYDRLYRKRNPLLQIAHPLISFDQQSKSKRNFRILQPHFPARPAAGRPGPAWLDYGFGHGSLLLKAPRWFRPAGCDLSPEAVASLDGLCGFLGRKMDLCTVDAFAARTAGAAFDFITCSHVLEHVPDDEAVLGQLASKLAPGGRILINLPINEVWNDPNHIRKYDEASIRALFAKCGLRIESTLACDRWTAFFLTHEMLRPAPKPVRLVLKAMRLTFAIIPLGLVDALERVFARKHPYQQFLALAVRDR